MLCNRCKKRLAVVFINKIENGKQASEGLCLKCAGELGIKAPGQMLENMGISEEDFNELSDEMGEFFEIYKHGKDYVIWGEIEIIYLTEELKIKWSFSSRDIFVRRDNKKAIALTEKDIIVTDWLGWCYHIGYDGELISELRVYEDWLA